MDITLTRSGNLSGLARVFYRSVEVSATSGFDYQAISSRQALFTSGKEELQISVRISQDALEEGDETFLLQLFNPGTGVTIGSRKDLQITILEDETAFIQWAQGVVRVSEDEAMVEVVATRSGGINSFATVDYETSGVTALAVTDFQSKSGTLNFGAGDTQKSVFISLNDDFVSEPNEEFTILLSDPGSAELGSTSQVRVIIEDDESSAGNIGWSVSEIQVAESEEQVDLVVERTGGNQGAVSVQYATKGGTALEGVDFTSASGTLNWINGSDTPRTISISKADDQVDEVDKIFEVELTLGTGDAVLVVSTVTVTIQDDDNAASEVGTIGFISEILSVEESSGTANIVVSRTGGTFGKIDVDYSFSDSTANAGTDFTGIDGSLSWEDGDGADKTIVVPIIDDAAFESDEAFFISLDSSTGGLLNDNFIVSVIIEDDDLNDSGTVVFAESSQTVSEGSSAVAVSIQRLGGSTGAVSVAYETNAGSAMASLDFISQVGVLNWVDGDSSAKEISISLLNDELFEGPEFFTVSLSDVDSGSVAGANSVHTITIMDDEEQPGTWFEFNRILYSGTEGSEGILIQVDRFGDGVGEASVRVSSADSNAVAGSDYVILDTVLFWEDGDSSPKLINLVILNDSLPEQSERVSLSLSEPSNNARIGDLSDGEALIYDDDRETGELVNLSTRGYVGLNDEVLIGGFIIFNGPQKVLIRAVGPSLDGVENVLPNPSLQIIDNTTQMVVEENDNWIDDTSQIQAIIDTGLSGLNTSESAIIMILPAGTYSAIVSGNGGTGIGAIEIYLDASAGLDGDLVNISTRGRVSSGAEILIGGLIISGSESKQLLFRGMGPSLIVPGSPSLADPELLLFNSSGVVIYSNDNWFDAINWDEIEATLFAPMDTESAMLLDLEPGVYTLHLRSAGGDTGIGSVEIYTLN